MASIEQVRNLAEVFKSYQFRINISNPPGAGASIELMQFRCTAAPIPGKQVEEVLVPLGGYNVKYPGRSIPVGVWTATFIEGTDLQVIQRMKEWQEVCHNQQSGVQGESADYKRNITIELLDNAGEVSQTHRMVGCWPQDTPDVALDTASSEAVRYDVTFAYDYNEIA